MSGDRLTTRTDGVHLAPETQAAAARYLTRTGNADLLLILGLAEDPEAQPMRLPRGLVRQQAGKCPLCGNYLPSHGVCRRSNRCREAARERGESA